MTSNQNISAPRPFDRSSYPVVDQKELGERIRKRRQDLGWSQAQVAEFLAISQPAISTYEKGEVTPPFHVIQMLCSLLGTDLVNGGVETTDTGALNLHPKIKEQAERLMADEGFRDMTELLTWLVKKEVERKNATLPADKLEKSMTRFEKRMSEMNKRFDAKWGK